MSFLLAFSSFHSLPKVLLFKFPSHSHKHTELSCQSVYISLHNLSPPLIPSQAPSSYSSKLKSFGCKLPLDKRKTKHLGVMIDRYLQSRDCERDFSVISRKCFRFRAYQFEEFSSKSLFIMCEECFGGK